MKQRTMDEMISYFNQQVDQMDIDRKYKMALLGMITAIGYQNKKQERKWETCFDCPLSHGCPKINGCTNDQAEKYASEIPDDCPIERKTGRWIKVGHIENTYLVSKCSVCGYQTIDAGNYCTNCGAYMRNAVETARDIVHQAIDNSVWSDTVDVEKMHKVVDDKYVEVEHDNQEQ